MAPFLWGGPIEAGGPTNPIGIIFGIIDFIAHLFGLGNNDIKVLQTAINNTWANLVESSVFLYNGLGFLSQAMDAAVLTVIKTVEHVIRDVIQGVLLKLVKAILDLLHKLHDLIAPMIAYLKKLQAIQRQLQIQYLRRFVDLIQRARRILVIFRLLHLSFANKLDAYLARLEGGVGAAFAKMVARLNVITNVLDTVLDPRLLLRPGHTLASVGGAIGAIQQAIGALGFRQLLCLPADNPAQSVIEPWAVTEIRTVTAIRHNTGDFAASRSGRDVALRQYAIDLGVQPLV